VKGDESQTQTAKDTARKAVQTKLVEHLATELHDNVAPRSSLPRVLPVVPVVVPVAHVDDDVEHKDEQPDDFDDFPSMPIKDIRKFQVGNVPPHLRVNLNPIQVNDDVVLIYAYESGVESGDSTVLHTAIGVATVVSLDRYDDDVVTVQWQSNGLEHGRVTGQFYPLWLRQTDTHYAQMKPEKDTHTPFIDVIQDFSMSLIKYGDILTKSKRNINRKTLRFICATPNAPWKMKNHDDQCICTK